MHEYISLLSYIKKLLNIIVYFFKTNHYIDYKYILLTKMIISKMILFN